MTNPKEEQTIDLVNKAAPTLENVGNCACNIVDRAVDSADNIIDKVIDIPFKFIRKAKDSTEASGTKNVTVVGGA